MAAEGETLLRELMEDTNLFHLNTLFGTSKTLFHQAVLAYDGGAHSGASLLCRSVLEAALYIALTRTKGKQERGTWNIVTPLKVDGQTRMVFARELISAMGKSRVLKDEQRTNLDRVFKQGNVIAHVVSRRDKQTWPLNKPRPEIRPWTTEAEAFQNLSDTADILRRLAYVAEKKPEWFGPQPRKAIQQWEAPGAHFAMWELDEEE